MSKPIVAIVGRPNVGNHLFNVLAGETISIVKDTPGVTRDRIYADCNWLNMNFTLVDTGGIEPDSRDIILTQMREQATRLPLTLQMSLSSSWMYVRVCRILTLRLRTCSANPESRWSSR